MQNRPDAPTLLDAVASFLLEEIGPKLEADKALGFRLMIAANLTTIVANELRSEDERFAAETAGLKRLLPKLADDAPLNSPRRAERLAALSTLEAALAKRLRTEGPDEAALKHLWETAQQTLKVTNPRFDLSEEP